MTARLADDIPIAGSSLGLAEMNRRAESLGLAKPKRNGRKTKNADHADDMDDSDFETPKKLRPTDETAPGTDKDSKRKNKRPRDEETGKESTPKHSKKDKEKKHDNKVSKREKKNKEVA